MQGHLPSVREFEKRESDCGASQTKERRERENKRKNKEKYGEETKGAKKICEKQSGGVERGAVPRFCRSAVSEGVGLVGKRGGGESQGRKAMSMLSYEAVRGTCLRFPEQLQIVIAGDVLQLRLLTRAVGLPVFLRENQDLLNHREHSDWILLQSQWRLSYSQKLLQN